MTIDAGYNFVMACQIVKSCLILKAHQAIINSRNAKKYSKLGYLCVTFEL